MTVDKDISARIAIIRLLLIGGIVFVHVPFNPQTSAYLGVYGVFDWLRAFLADTVFRIGVPALSAISGLLLFRNGLEALDYRRMLGSKLSSIVLPFVLWNGVMLLLVLALQQAGLMNGYFPSIAEASFRQVATLILAIEAWPINLPLYFLHDLLICLVLAPVIGLAVKRFPVATLTLLFVYALLPFAGPVLFKKSILFGFAAGAALALHRIDIRTLDRHAAPVVIGVTGLALVLSVFLFQTGPDYPAWLDALNTAMTLLGSIAAWLLTALLRDTRIGRAMVRAPAGLSFWMFCAHYPILIACWMVWGRLQLDFYPLFYGVSVPVTFAVLLGSHALVHRFMPGLYGILTGQRSAAGPSSFRPARAMAHSKGD